MPRTGPVKCYYGRESKLGRHSLAGSWFMPTVVVVASTPKGDDDEALLLPVMLLLLWLLLLWLWLLAIDCMGTP